MGRFGTIEAWLEHCRRLVGPDEDRDNVMLFTGPEGEGKSTLIFQVMCALDPSFDAARMCMTIEEFLPKAPATSRRGAVALDEALINARMGMHRDVKALINWLQVCRGLNLHIGIAYPHEELADKSIKNYRVRWNVHVARRGIMELRVRVRKQRGRHVWYDWVVIDRWRYGRNRGRKWEEYLVKKEDHMRRGSTDDDQDVEEDVDPREALRALGVGYNGRFVKELLAAVEHHDPR